MEHFIVDMQTEKSKKYYFIREEVSQEIVLLPSQYLMHKMRAKGSPNTIKRKLRQGYGTMKEKDNGAGDTIFFNLYLIDKFGNAANKKKNTVLDYEMEYLLGGKASDKDNLEYVIGRIRILRFAVNYLVEMNLRSGMEKTFFRADACVSGADFDMTCYLRRGIRYQYHILYQYQ